MLKSLPGIKYKKMPDESKINVLVPAVLNGDIFTINEFNEDKIKYEIKDTPSNWRWQNLVLVQLPGLAALFLLMMSLTTAVRDQEHRTLLNLPDASCILLRGKALHKSNQFFFIAIIWIVVGLSVTAVEIFIEKAQALSITLISAFLFILAGMFSFSGIYQVTQLYNQDHKFIPNARTLSLAWLAYMLCLFTGFCEILVNLRHRK